MDHDELKYDLQYFKKHSDRWSEISEKLGTAAQKASEAGPPDGSVYTSLAPIWIDAVIHVRDVLTNDLLSKGATETGSVSDKLIETLRMYANQESENSAAADAVINEVI